MGCWNWGVAQAPGLDPNTLEQLPYRELLARCVQSAQHRAGPAAPQDHVHVPWVGL